MKRYLISSVAVMVVLGVAWVVFGQSEESSKETGEQRRDVMKKKWEQMSDEEREKIREQMRERFGARGFPLGREGQLKAIKVVEEQIAKLKEGIGPEGRRGFRELPPEERARLKERWTKVREERQKAIITIEEQIAKLKGERPPVVEPRGFFAELLDVRELAVKEKAKETAERLGKLIARFRREPRGREGIEPRRPELPGPPRESPARLGGESAAFGKKAPDFTLKSFDGKTVSLSDYKGKIVVLEWFNFECPFVRYHYDTAPTMVNLADKYKGKNVVWFAVNSTSHTTVEANNEFAQKHNLPYPILDDSSGQVGHAYGAKTTPHIFIIDTNGNIVYVGAIDNSPMGRVKEGVVNYVEQALAELTSGKIVTTSNTQPYGCNVKYAR